MIRILPYDDVRKDIVDYVYSTYMRHNFTFDEIKRHILALYNKLETRSMNTTFWVIADRSDFKPLKKTILKNRQEVKQNIRSIREVKDNILQDKEEYYKHKKLAEISVDMNEHLVHSLENDNTHNITLGEHVLVVKIKIHVINETGMLDHTHNSTWTLNVKYCVDDFRTINFTIKNIDVLVHLAADRVITTNENKCISYKKLLKKINK